MPRCAGLVDPAITEATMFPFQNCGDTKQLTVEPDDVGGVCGAYPAATDPGVCGPPDPVSGAGTDAGTTAPSDDDGGCCGAGSHGGGPGRLAFPVLVQLRRRRRRETTVTASSPACEAREAS